MKNKTIETPEDNFALLPGRSLQEVIGHLKNAARYFSFQSTRAMQNNQCGAVDYAQLLVTINEVLHTLHAIAK